MTDPNPEFDEDNPETGYWRNRTYDWLTYWRTQAESRQKLAEAQATIEHLERELKQVKADRDHYKERCQYGQLHHDPFGAVDGWPFSD